MKKEIAIGIDLGTTYSVAAYINEYGLPEVIKNSRGETLTPSVVYFENDRIIVGTEAKSNQALGEENAISFFKRSMGDDTYFFIPDDSDKEYSATELSALVLAEIKKNIEQQLQCDVRKVVITVPAYFDNTQREETIKAAEAAGLEVLKIINEPTAAAIAYGLNKADDTASKKILIYDLGGGTFDVTIINIHNQNFQVIATGGDHELGGKDWDDRLLTLLTGKFTEEFDEDPLKDPDSYNDLAVKAENLKKQLSDRNTGKIKIVYNGNSRKYDITRQEFEEATADLLERTRQLSELVLSEANLTWSDLDGVLPVGGSTKMPMVSTWIEQMTNNTTLKGINVDEAVAKGAAIQAAIQLNKQQTDGLLIGESTNILLLGGIQTIQDVMSHSLGLIAENEDRSRYINTIIIPKNTLIPTSSTHPYKLRTSTTQANELEVYMTQGEVEYPTDNKILGKYVFNNIVHIPSGETVIDVSYAYNENGMVEVSAIQKENAKVLDLTIHPIPDDMSWLDTAPKNHQTVISDSLHLLLVMDLSGSMSGRPLRESIKAAHSLVEKLDMEHSTVGVIGFATQTQAVGNPKNDLQSVKKDIDELEYVSYQVGSGTSANPFKLCHKMLTGKEGRKFIVVLTDGEWFRQSNAIEWSKKCATQGIEIIAIGFGDANEQFLKKIATSDENALLTNLNQIINSFSKIGQVLASPKSEGIAINS